MHIEERQNELLEELSFFQDWTERYEYVIGLGKKLPALPEEAKVGENLIKGCQSQVWLTAKFEDGLMHYFADSDSLITKGMIALYIRIFDGQKPEDVIKADAAFIEKTGLKEHLAPTRANALNLMASEIKRHALAATSY